jgi:hypothetical protein
MVALTTQHKDFLRWSKALFSGTSLTKSVISQSARIWYVKNVFVLVNNCVQARKSALPSVCVSPPKGLKVALGWHLREGLFSHAG